MNKVLSLLVLALVVLTGCGDSKPSTEDLENSFYSGFEPGKKVGVDLTEYFEVDSFEILESFGNEKGYVFKLVPSIKVKKSISKEKYKEVSNELGTYAEAFTIPVKMLEILNKHSSGELSYQDMIANLGGVYGYEYEGKLEKGDVFSGTESTYKFRKTDQGWMPVN